MNPVLVVAGARPNFMKVAPIIAALDAAGISRLLVHTGQHYDAAMSDTFFSELGIPNPDRHLGVGSGSHAQQTARIMEAIEPVLNETRPSWVVVVGDVNSTLACALVASKLRPLIGCRVAHVEAGLRSRDWSMPEEVNRVLTDRLSDLLLTPSLDAESNLIGEGIEPERIVFVGNVMIDTLLRILPSARALDAPAQVGAGGQRFALATLHRPSNVDAPDSLRTILSSLSVVARTLPVVFPMHPRTRQRVQDFGLETLLEPIKAVPPLGYTQMLGLQAAAAVVVTDSGGVQEETTVLGVPCVTLRESTERPVTISKGTNRLAPWPLTEDGIVKTIQDALAEGPVPTGSRSPQGWDGRASERIVAAILTRGMER